MLRRLFGRHTTTGLAFLAGAMLATAGSAAATHLITGAEIKDGSIGTKDLTKAVRAQLKKAGLQGQPGAAGSPGPKGDAGAKGEIGAKGDQGVPGVASGPFGYDALSFVKYANFTITYDLPSMAAQSCLDLSTGIGSDIQGDDIVLSSVPGLEQGLVTTGTAETPTTVSIRVCNVTAGAIDPASHDFRYTVLD